MEMLKLDLPLVSSADIPNIENYLGRQAVDNINLFKRNITNVQLGTFLECK